MKTYPSTKFMNGLTKGAGIPEGNDWYVFDKLDGSNIRVEWNHKRGFYKYGRRNALLDDSNPWLKHDDISGILNNTVGPKLDAEFRKRKYKRMLCFFEFNGDKSFSGHHENEEHRLTLIDFNLHPKGFMGPEDFVRLCVDAGLSEGTDYARVLYHGEITQELLESIRNSTLPGMTFEGVVCKSQGKKVSSRRAFKVKASLWLDKLRVYCKDDMELFKRLA